jgi:hypothetical protein
LILKFTKLLDGSVFNKIEINVRVVNPNVLMTMDTNPEALRIYMLIVRIECQALIIC